MRTRNGRAFAESSTRVSKRMLRQRKHEPTVFLENVKFGCRTITQSSVGSNTGDAMGASGTNVTNGAASKSMNEGCVAVEHLKGYALQNRYDSSRPVLCFREFCATPNHPLIIHGKYTSMKIICGKDGE